MGTFWFQYFIFQNNICIRFSLPDVFRELFKIQMAPHHDCFSAAKNYRLIKSWKTGKSGNEENLEVKLILLRKNSFSKEVVGTDLIN